MATPKNKSPPHSTESKSVGAAGANDLEADESLDVDDDQRSTSSGRTTSPEVASAGALRGGLLGWDVYLKKLQASVHHSNRGSEEKAELPLKLETKTRLPQSQEADLIACAATAATQVAAPPLHAFRTPCVSVCVCAHVCANSSASPCTRFGCYRCTRLFWLPVLFPFFWGRCERECVHARALNTFVLCRHFVRFVDHFLLRHSLFFSP